jgi:8-oxo-dGTP pyrophosphatase MutT (NUDIX family)
VTIYAVRRRVACYVTRSSDAGPELLVLDHVDDASHPSAAQVPAGDILPFESLEPAAFRRIDEECGLSGLAFQGELGAVELGLRDPGGGPSMTVYVHIEAPTDTEPAWRHEVSGEGPDSGMTVCCRWEPLPLSFSLAAGHDAYLDRLTA